MYSWNWLKLKPFKIQILLKIDAFYQRCNLVLKDFQLMILHISLKSYIFYILHLCQISTKIPLENNPLETGYLRLKSAYCIIHHTLHYLSLKFLVKARKVIPSTSRAFLKYIQPWIKLILVKNLERSSFQKY